MLPTWPKSAPSRGPLDRVSIATSDEHPCPDIGMPEAPTPTSSGPTSSRSCNPRHLYSGECRHRTPKWPKVRNTTTRPKPDWIFMTLNVTQIRVKRSEIWLRERDSMFPKVLVEAQVNANSCPLEAYVGNSSCR